MADTTTLAHEWVEMVVTPVEVIIHEGEPVVLPAGEPSEITIGCFRCNMGLDEGVSISCPGEDLFTED